MVPYDPSEQDEVIEQFVALLRGPTRDGGAKRAKGEKVSWKVDTSHEAAIHRHIRRRYCDGQLEDPDSGCHPLVHAAWRCLAVAWQETHQRDASP